MKRNHNYIDKSNKELIIIQQNSDEWDIDALFELAYRADLEDLYHDDSVTIEELAEKIEQFYNVKL